MRASIMGIVSDDASEHPLILGSLNTMVTQIVQGIESEDVSERVLL